MLPMHADRYGRPRKKRSCWTCATCCTTVLLLALAGVAGASFYAWKAAGTELQQLVKDAAGTQAQLKQQSDEVAKLNQQVMELLAKQNQLQTEVDARTAEVQQLKSAGETAATQQRAADASLQASQTALTAAEQRVTAAEQRATGAEAQAGQAMSALQELKSQLEGLKQRLQQQSSQGASSSPIASKVADAVISGAGTAKELAANASESLSGAGASTNAALSQAADAVTGGAARLVSQTGNATKQVLASASDAVSEAAQANNTLIEESPVSKEGTEAMAQGTGDAVQPSPSDQPSIPTPESGAKQLADVGSADDETGPGLEKPLILGIAKHQASSEL